MPVIEEVRRQPDQQLPEAAASLSGIAARASQATRLSTLAHLKVTAALNGFGNGISEKHNLALRELIESLTAQAMGIQPGRYAYALPCGAGKTQSVVAWIAAVYELGLELSVAVSASQIEALCGIKRALIGAGVPEQMIGLRHSYGKAASEPDTGDADRPIMLVSHARVRAARGFPPSCLYRGKARDLLIWDESLMTTDTATLSWLEVEASAKLLASDSTECFSPMRDWLQRVVLRVQEELDAQHAGAAPETLMLLDGVDCDAVKSDIRAQGSYGTRLRCAAVHTVESLVHLTQGPVAVASTGNGRSGDGLIHYKVAVDPQLLNIAVLDASFPVRTLAQGGGIVDGTTEAMRTCKAYDQVTVRQIKLATGKSTIKRDAAKMAAMVEQVATVIRAIPDDEHILIFAFKGDDKNSMLSATKQALSEAGVEIGATIDGEDRISWLTWGCETSLSAYSHCKHIILAGVLRRNQLDLAASVAAREDNLGYRLPSRQLRDVAQSEMAHCVLQAMNRGACRTADAQGMAGAMTLTILANAPGLRDVLADSLPGVCWELEEGCKSTSRTNAAAHGVAAFLKCLPADVTRISIRGIKKGVAVPLGRDAWRDALEIGLVLACRDGANGRWRRLAQSVERMSD